MRKSKLEKTITLVYLPHDEEKVCTKKIQLPRSTQIQDLPKVFCAKSLALWQWDGIGSGGMVTGNYLSQGPLEDGKWYMHFWKGQDIIAVFKEKQFKFNHHACNKCIIATRANDKTQWKFTKNKI